MTREASHEMSRSPQQSAPESFSSNCSGSNVPLPPPTVIPSHTPPPANMHSTFGPDRDEGASAWAHRNLGMAIIDAPPEPARNRTPSPIVRLPETPPMKYSKLDTHYLLRSPKEARTISSSSPEQRNPPHSSMQLNATQNTQTFPFTPQLQRSVTQNMAVPPSTPSSIDKDTDGSGNFASDFLRAVITGDFSSDGVQMSFRGATYFLPDARLESFLENLPDFVQIVRSDPQMFGDLLRSSLPLLFTPRRVKLHNNACELQRRGFVAWATIKSLSIDWEAVSMSITPLGYGIQHVHVHAPELPGSIENPHQDTPVVHKLRDHLKAALDIEVLVLGYRESNRCIVVAREDNPWQGYAITGVTLP